MNPAQTRERTAKQISQCVEVSSSAMHGKRILVGGHLGTTASPLIALLAAATFAQYTCHAPCARTQTHLPRFDATGAVHRLAGRCEESLSSTDGAVELPAGVEMSQTVDFGREVYALFTTELQGRQ